MCISASPLSRSSDIVDRVQVLRRRCVENDISAVATETGSVHRIWTKRLIKGKTAGHKRRMCRWHLMELVYCHLFVSST
jgi:hypothetical protein